jgi:hypothetical protein
MAFLHRQKQRGTTRNTGYGNKPPPENSIKGFMTEEEYEEKKAAQPRTHATYTIHDGDGENGITDDFTNKSNDIMSYCIKGICYIGLAAWIAQVTGMNPYAKYGGGKTKRNKQRKKKTEKKRKNKTKRKTSRRAL